MRGSFACIAVSKGCLWTPSRAHVHAIFNIGAIATRVAYCRTAGFFCAISILYCQAIPRFLMQITLNTTHEPALNIRLPYNTCLTPSFIDKTQH